MTKNIYEPSIYTQVSASRGKIKTTRQKPGAFRWWECNCDPDDPDDAANGCTGQEPALNTGWSQPSDGSGLEKFAFRLHADGSLEFKGHLRVTGATSPSVAFTLPGANAGEVQFRLPHDQFFHTTITTDDGTSFTLALVHIDSATGDVTITWPAT